MLAQKSAHSILKLCVFLLVISLFGTYFLIDILRVRSSLALTEALPEPGTQVLISKNHVPAMLEAIVFNKEDPLKLSFIIDANDEENIDDKTRQKLVEYFLSALTLPSESLWVNLSPYEQDRIGENRLLKTQMGRELLAQDYILKQLSSSLTDPRTKLGKDYWAKSSNNEDTFNKIWIVPDGATVYEDGLKAAVVDARLSVMHEEDYLAKDQLGIANSAAADKDPLRELIIPQIEREVNYGKNFAPLRQIYNSLVLANWFKAKFLKTFYKHYIDSSRIKGVDTASLSSKDNIYQLYVEAFKKGVYDYIKTEKDQSNRSIKKRYFSGGMELGTNEIEITTQTSAVINNFSDNTEKLDVSLDKAKGKFNEDAYFKDLEQRTTMASSIPVFSKLKNVMMTFVPIALAAVMLNPEKAMSQEIAASQVIIETTLDSSNTLPASVDSAYENFRQGFYRQVARQVGVPADRAPAVIKARFEQAHRANDIQSLRSLYTILAVATDNIDSERRVFAREYLNYISGDNIMNQLDTSQAISDSLRTSYQQTAGNCTSIMLVSKWIMETELGIRGENGEAIFEALSMDGHVAFTVIMPDNDRFVMDLSAKQTYEIPSTVLGNMGTDSASFRWRGDDYYLTQNEHFEILHNIGIFEASMGDYERAHAHHMRMFAMGDTATKAFDDVLNDNWGGNFQRDFRRVLRMAEDYNSRHQNPDFANYHARLFNYEANILSAYKQYQAERAAQQGNWSQRLEYLNEAKRRLEGAINAEASLNDWERSALLGNSEYSNALQNAQNKLILLNAQIADLMLRETNLQQLNAMPQTAFVQSKIAFVNRNFDLALEQAVVAFNSERASMNAAERAQLSQYLRDVYVQTATNHYNMAVFIRNFRDQQNYNQLASNELATLRTIRDAMLQRYGSTDADYQSVNAMVQELEEETQSSSVPVGGIDLDDIQVNVQPLGADELKNIAIDPYNFAGFSLKSMQKDTNFDVFSVFSVKN